MHDELPPLAAFRTSGLPLRNENPDVCRVNFEIRFVCLVCLTGFLAGSAQSDEPQTQFQVKTRNADDRVIIQLTEDRVVFTLMSPSGIGEAKIARMIERWPRTIVLRLRLGGLERLRIDNGKCTLSASVSSGGDHRTSVSLSEEGKMEIPIDRSSPFWTEIRIFDAQGHSTKEIPLKDGVFEVILPEALFASNPPTLTLDWIDFYR
jgi:hypothetical protein